MEAAVTTIQDCDFGLTVDAADKVLAYGNWLRLQRGSDRYTGEPTAEQSNGGSIRTGST